MLEKDVKRVRFGNYKVITSEKNLRSVFLGNASVKAMFDLFQNSGHELYAVGGCVRDTIIGTKPHDYDFCTDATPEEMKEIAANAPEGVKITVFDTGIKYGTLVFRVKSGKKFYGLFEVTTYRKEGRYLNNRKPESVAYTKDVLDDFSRRDFTMNAMGWNPTKGLFDPYNGMEDLERSLIRTCGNPKERFEEDALRILRLARFAQTYHLEMEEETFDAAIEYVPLLKNISRERIGTELERIFQLPGDAASDSVSMLLRDIFMVVNDKWQSWFDVSDFRLRPAGTVAGFYILTLGMSPEEAVDYIKTFGVGKRVANTVGRIRKALTMTDQPKAALELLTKYPEDDLPVASQLIDIYGTNEQKRMTATWLRAILNKEPIRIEDLAIKPKPIKDAVVARGLPESLVGEILRNCQQLVWKFPSYNDREQLKRHALALVDLEACARDQDCELDLVAEDL